MAYPAHAKLFRPPTVLREGSVAMIDHGPLPQPEAPPAVREEEAGLGPPHSLRALEDRLRRLEDAVAALQEHQVEELRTAAARPAPDRPRPDPTPTLAEGTAAIADAGRRLLPLAMNLLRPPEAAAANGP